MASSTNFGASIVPENRPAIHLPQPVTDSPVLTPAVSRDGDESLRDAYTSNKIPAQSPFYTHPPASHELVNEKVSNLEVFEKDIESGNDAPLTPATEADEHPFSSKIALEHSSKECTMWPSKQTLKKEYKAQKSEKRKTRGCLACAPARDQWSKLSKRNKLLAKIALALFLAGIAVAIGVGISSAVKGTYYVSEGHSQTVGR